MKVTLDQATMDPVLKAEIERLRKENKSLAGKVRLLERQKSHMFSAADLNKASDYLRQARDSLDTLLGDRSSWGDL